MRGEGAARVGDAGRGTGTGRDDAGRDARDEHRRGNGNERMGVVLQGREDVDACGHTVVRGLDGASATARARRARGEARGERSVHEELSDVAHDARDGDETSGAEGVFGEVRDDGHGHGEGLLTGHHDARHAFGSREAERARGGVVDAQEDDVNQDGGEDDGKYGSDVRVDELFRASRDGHPHDDDEARVVDERELRLVRRRESRHSRKRLPRDFTATDGYKNGKNELDEQFHRVGRHTARRARRAQRRSRRHDGVEIKRHREHPDQIRRHRQHQRQRHVTLRIPHQRHPTRQRRRHATKQRQSVSKLHRSHRQLHQNKSEQGRESQNSHPSVRQRPASALQRLRDLFRLQRRPGDDKDDDDAHRLEDAPSTDRDRGERFSGGGDAQTEREGETEAADEKVCEKKLLCARERRRWGRGRGRHGARGADV